MVVEETWEKAIVVLFMLIVFWSIVATVVFAVKAVLVEDIAHKVYYIAISVTFAIISVSVARVVKYLLH
jgi:hypothetical protein